MKKKELNWIVDPATHQKLTFKGESSDIMEGCLLAPTGQGYPVSEGIPNLIYPEIPAEEDVRAKSFYDGRVDAYDKNLHLTFKTHGEDEEQVRNGFIDLLELKPESKVLEIAAGTGRDSELIAARLGPQGLVCASDISAEMLKVCREKLATAKCSTSIVQSSATALPHPDNTFDAAYSFGGLGEFSDIPVALQEMVRVAKPGAKIVVGDESMPVWLRHTEFAKILTKTNPQFEARVPFEAIPLEAREVCVRWVIGGVFYLIDFRVGEGEPTGDFDYEIPGPRGGTLRTRYEGQLEGVTLEAKEMVARAAAERGLSLHAWLEEAVRAAAGRDLA